MDKHLHVSELRYERIDVIAGSVVTGLIAVFVVIACAATLHATGQSIDDARDVAVGLEPLAGQLAAALFGVGLLGAAPAGGRSAAPFNRLLAQRSFGT